mgnify:CR=1 FL=1
MLKEQEDSSGNVPGYVKKLLHRGHPEQFKEYFKDDFERYSTEDKNADNLEQSMDHSTVYSYYGGSVASSA